jgi:hypothetical protein
VAIYPSDGLYPSEELFPERRLFEGEPGARVLRVDEKPSNDLTVEIEKPDGTVIPWNPAARDLGSRPLNPAVGSKLMEGYTGGSVDLAREHAEGGDLAKYDTVRFRGVSGTIAGEGRVADFAPDNSSDEARVYVEAEGWMAHASDRPLEPIIYVDRDKSHWGGYPTGRRKALEAGNYSPGDAEVIEGTYGAESVLRLKLEGTWQAPMLPISGAFYKPPPGANVVSVSARYTGTPQAAANLNFVLQFIYGASDTDGNLKAAGDIFTATAGETNLGFAACKMVAFEWYYPSTPAGADGFIFGVDLTELAVFGDHGLAIRGGKSGGYYVSDLIKHSAATAAPLLDTSQIADTPTIVTQAVVEDLKRPYDFWVELNKYERRHLAVWGKRQLHYDQFKPDAVDWRIREGETGVNVQWTGAPTAAAKNGIIVRYQDVVSGRAELVTPNDDERLRDRNPNIAANAHELDDWESVQLSDPDSREGAIRIGQLVLEELNRQAQPGKITVRGNIRDGARNWREGWAPKAGQTVLIENREGAPRMITEPQWDGASETLTMTVDGEPQSSDALLDKVLTEMGRT